MDKLNAVQELVRKVPDSSIKKSFEDQINTLTDLFQLHMLGGLNDENVRRDIESFCGRVRSHLASIGDEGALLILNQNLQKGKRPRRTADVIQYSNHCPNEECEGMRIYDEITFRLTCDTCGEYEDMTGMQLQEKHPSAGREKNNNISKEMDTLEEMLAVIQGNISNKSDEYSKTSYEKIAQHSGALFRQLENTYPKHDIYVKDVRAMLSQLKLRCLCKYAPYFHVQFTGKPTIQLTDAELMYIRDYYRKIVHNWKNVKTGFRNLPWTRAILYLIVSDMNIEYERKTLIIANIYAPEEGTLARLMSDFWTPVTQYIKQLPD